MYLMIKKVVLIAGGADKKIPYDSLGKALFEKARVLILTGPTAKLIENAARDEYKRQGKEYDIVTYHCQNYEEAVEVCLERGKKWRSGYSISGKYKF